MVSNEFLPSIGGVQTHVYELAIAMVRLGHKVAVVTRQKSSLNVPDVECMEGVDIYRHKLPNNHLIYDWALKRILKRLVTTEGFDCIHVHGMRPLTAAKKVGVPVFFTNHTSSYLKRIKGNSKTIEKMRKQFEGVKVILAPSQELKDATVASGYKGPVHFVSNGVDHHRFYPQPSELRKQLGIPDGAFVAVLARRLVEKNGVLYFAKAITAIDDKDFYVIVAGDGVDRPEFESIINQGGCSDRVKFLGGVDNKAMPSVFSAGNISVLPSLMEATSIAGLEAMACGLALVGTNVGGIPYIIDDNNTGLLVNPADAESLSKAIKYCLDNREHCAGMSQRALEQVHQRFSWDIIAEQTLQYFHDNLSNHH